MKILDFAWKIIAVVVFLLVLTPIVVVVVISFSAGNDLSFPLPGYSIRWFREFFTTDNLRSAFLLSLALATASSAAATAIGTMGAVYVSRQRGALPAVLQGAFLAPLAFPAIVLGMALLLLYRTLGMPTLPGLLAAHVVTCLPYVFRASLGSLLAFDVSLEEAAQSLGAGPVRSFFKVTLPVIWPGVFSGALFAFVVSLGELNTAIFLTGPGWVTLPIEIFSYLQFEGSQLVVAAASSLQVLAIAGILTLLCVLVGARRAVGAKQ